MRPLLVNVATALTACLIVASAPTAAGSVATSGAAAAAGLVAAAGSVATSGAAAAAGLVAAAGSVATSAPAAAGSDAAAGPIALHAGDSITDRALFSYLAYPVAPGDWVRYRVTFADRSTVDKTIGFGAENVDGRRTLYIETHVRAQAVTGLPAGSTVGIGTDAVLKTYVAGSSFGDLSYVYTVVTSALKVGGFEYEIKPGTGETYSALSGAADFEARDGTVRSVEAIDLRVGGQTLHTTHVVASFRAAPLPVGGLAMPFTIELWQSPEAPLGTVAIRSEGARAVDWRLVAFGRGNYSSLFSKTLDRIRQASQPTM